MHTDEIIIRLKQRCGASQSQDSSMPPFNPAASPKLIADTIAVLGFPLPRLLCRIYREVGNGGSALGPGYGLLGLPAESEIKSDNIVSWTSELASYHPWWDDYVVICDWGCAVFSCIDCSDDEFPVFRFDGNQLDPDDDPEEPPELAWWCESDTFSDWIVSAVLGPNSC